MSYIATDQLAKAAEQLRKALELAPDDDLRGEDKGRSRESGHVSARCGAGRRSAANHAVNAGTNISGAGGLYPIEACRPDRRCNAVLAPTAGPAVRGTRGNKVRSGAAHFLTRLNRNN